MSDHDDSIARKIIPPPLPHEVGSGASMRYLVKALVRYNASDLHIKVGRPPLYRINGKLVPAKMADLSVQQVEQIIQSVLTDPQRVELERRLQVDLSFSMDGFGRFRCSAFFQKGTLSAVIRLIPVNIPNLDTIGVPLVLKELCQKPRGLILVTGATGSGKSTTLAAMVKYINENMPVHVLTVEDPIEFLHGDIKGTITQREVGADTRSFEDALFAGLRQDPDVIVIGELRNIITMQIALTAAETGHLVISTLHTKDAKSTIERILSVFPQEEKNQVRIQLASTLVGVVSQTLLLRSDGRGQIPACEVLVNSPTIENLILRNEVHLIPENMANSAVYYKMQVLNQDLARLVASGVVSQDEALKASSNPDDLKLLFSGLSHDASLTFAKE